MNMGELMETDSCGKGLPIFESPQCLIETSSDGRLIAREDVLRQITALDKDMVVVAIAGLYRTGKSFIMNRLAGKSSGFALGATIQSATKGIWAWAKPHPLDDDKYLLLIDTEGLGDVEKGNATHDAWIFCLATLLSSVLVYNVMGAINDDSLKQIHFISTMSKLIKTKQQTNPSDDQDFDSYFPDLVIAIRDLNLELNLHGEKISEDEYLNNCLKLKPESDNDAHRFNDTRICIRKYFKSRRCFTFDRPGGRDVLRLLDTVDESQISPEFIKDATVFCDHVYNHGPIKKLETGRALNGSMWAVMVQTYIESIGRGDVPCIENATVAMITKGNAEAVEAAVELYRENIHKMVSLPTPDDKTISDEHAAALQESITLFLSKAFCDTDHQYLNELHDQIRVEYEGLVCANNDASQKKCWDYLNNSDEKIKTKLQQGDYSRPGGYLDYCSDLQQVQQQYLAVALLGVKAEKVLTEYVANRMEEGNGIMAADKQLTEKEKQATLEKQRALEAENKKKLAEQEAINLQSQIVDREKANNEIMKQQRAQHDREIKQVKEIQEKIQQAREAENTKLAAERQEMRQEMAKQREKDMAQIKELQRQLQQTREEGERKLAAERNDSKQEKKQQHEKDMTLVKELQKQAQQIREEGERKLLAERKTLRQDMKEQHERDMALTREIQQKERKAKEEAESKSAAEKKELRVEMTKQHEKLSQARERQAREQEAKEVAEWRLKEKMNESTCIIS